MVREAAPGETRALCKDGIHGKDANVRKAALSRRWHNHTYLKFLWLSRRSRSRWLHSAARIAPEGAAASSRAAEGGFDRRPRPASGLVASAVRPRRADAGHLTAKPHMKAADVGPYTSCPGRHFESGLQGFRNITCWAEASLMTGNSSRRIALSLRLPLLSS